MPAARRLPLGPSEKICGHGQPRRGYASQPVRVRPPGLRRPTSARLASRAYSVGDRVPPAATVGCGSRPAVRSFQRRPLHRAARRRLPLATRPRVFRRVGQLVGRRAAARGGTAPIIFGRAAASAADARPVSTRGCRHAWPARPFLFLQHRRIRGQFPRWSSRFSGHRLLWHLRPVRRRIGCPCSTGRAALYCRTVMETIRACRQEGCLRGVIWQL